MEDTDREQEGYGSGINATNSVTVICQTNATDLYDSLVPTGISPLWFGVVLVDSSDYTLTNIQTY